MAELSTLEDPGPVDKVFVSDRKNLVATSPVSGRKSRLWKISVIVLAGLLLFTGVVAVTVTALYSSSSSDSVPEGDYGSGSNGNSDLNVEHHGQIESFAVADACNPPAFCAEGDVMADIDDCTRYFVCQNGRWSSSNCGNSCFHVDLGICDTCGDGTECQQPCPTVTGTTTPPPDAAPCEQHKYNCMEGWMYPDHYYCNYYWVCAAGVLDGPESCNPSYFVFYFERQECFTNDGTVDCDNRCPSTTAVSLPLSTNSETPQWTRGLTSAPDMTSNEPGMTTRYTEPDETSTEPTEPEETEPTEPEETEPTVPPEPEETEPTEGPVTPTTTTTASPLPDDREPPVYSTILFGNFTSLPDGDFDFDCTNRYSSELRDRALDMIPMVNNKLGSELCNQHIPGDFSMMSVSTILTTTGPQGETDLNFKTVVDRNLRIDDVYDCLAEVSYYLRDHVNWGLPLLPQLPGCPLALFDPPVFYSSGDEWFCVSTSQERTPSVPGYELDIASNFTTFSEQDLSSQCAIDYSNDLMDKVAVMQFTLNNEQLGSHLCPGVSISVITSTSSLVYQGPKGIASVQFIMQSADHHRFTDIFSCADEVMEYLFDHANWGLPLLPQIPDCPFLVFHEQRFYEEGQRWLCLSF